MSGWIKIYREITRHWIWDNPSYFKAWISILLTVNHDDNKVLINGEVIECNRGQSLYSLEGWVKVFGKGWTRQKVRTFFNLLKSDEMIEIKGLRKTTQLTVCNYDKYQNMQHTLNTQNTDNNQNDEKINTDMHQKSTQQSSTKSGEYEILQHTNNTQTTRRQHADNTQTTTNKNDKNDKNEKEIISLYHDLCPNMSKIQGMNNFRKGLINARMAEFGLEKITYVLRIAGESHFLNGKNDRLWKADFEWIMRPRNFIKILEGKYINAKKVDIMP